MSGPEPLSPIPDPDWLDQDNCGLPTEPAEGHGLAGLIPGVSHFFNSSAATTGGRWADAVAGGLGAGAVGAVAGAAFKLTGVGGLLTNAIVKVLVMKLGGIATGAAADKLQKAASNKLGYQTSAKSAINAAVRNAVMTAEAKRTDRRAGLARLKAEGQVGKLEGVGHSMFGGAVAGGGS